MGLSGGPPRAQHAPTRAARQVVGETKREGRRRGVCVAPLVRSGEAAAQHHGPKAAQGAHQAVHVVVVRHGVVLAVLDGALHTGDVCGWPGGGQRPSRGKMALGLPVPRRRTWPRSKQAPGACHKRHMVSREASCSRFGRHGGSRSCCASSSSRVSLSCTWLTQARKRAPDLRRRGWSAQATYRGGGWVGGRGGARSEPAAPAWGICRGCKGRVARATKQLPLTSGRWRRASRHGGART